jgi:ABC-type dipeptide/oligopeptide/nickel transport system ATPase component
MSDSPLTNPASPLLQVRNLSVTFSRDDDTPLQAVKGISWHMHEGETLAVVGESGSGKSVTALSLTRLMPPPPICQISGEILYQGTDLLSLKDKQLRRYRGKEIAYIFQEPATSLNPVFTVGYQIEEALKLHFPEMRNRRERVVELLDQVGIVNPHLRHLDYPHQLSGGMQQRVMIAMALACQPRILVADEPTTALDVTIQAQILELIQDLQQKHKMGVLLITHNFGIVSGFAKRVMVMFRGQIVEIGDTQKVLQNPQHPYTKALIRCIPKLGNHQHRLPVISYEEIERSSPKQIPIIHE